MLDREEFEAQQRGVKPALPSPSRAPLPLGAKLAYGFGSIAYGIKDNGFSTLLLLFYNQVIGLRADLVGLAVMVALVLDAFIDPVIGHLSDHTRSRWGRRHPYMYAAALPIGLLYLLLWNPPHAAPAMIAVYLGVVAVLVRTAISAYEVPSSALAPDLTVDYHERTSVLGWRYLFGWAGGMGMLFVTFAVLLAPTPEFPVGQLNPAGYHRYAFVASSLMVIAILVSALGTHRRISALPAVPVQRISLAGTLRGVAAAGKNRAFRTLLASGVFGFTAQGLTFALSAYFNTFFWELPSTLLAISVPVTLAGVALAFALATVVSRRWDKRAAAAGMTLAYPLVAVLPYLARFAGLLPANGEPWLLVWLGISLICATALGVGGAILSASMMADVVEDAEARTGQRTEGLFFAGSFFMQKCVSGLGRVRVGRGAGASRFSSRREAGARSGVGTNPSSSDLLRRAGRAGERCGLVPLAVPARWPARARSARGVARSRRGPRCAPAGQRGRAAAFHLRRPEAMTIETQAVHETPDEPLGFDPAALRARYRAERDKRLRADGNAQYAEMTGRFANFLEDPYVEAPIDRAPLADEVEVAVIGGGFGGLLAGAKLREAGIDDIRLIEKGGEVGGTWYWNRYPGAACDIESYVYLPLLEETGFMPARKYANGPEIRSYSRQIAERYDLYPGALLQTEVTDLAWDEDSRRWTVSTNRGDALRARFVIMANGPLHRPKLPGIPGIESYAGHSFHTSRWDYAYTGGGPDGGLTGLADKRVGIIGTGATAVQVVPHLAADARELFVFQRTPSSIDVRGDRPTDQEWAAGLKPGWHRHRMENFNTLVSGGWAEEDLVADGWTDIIRSLGIVARLRAAKGNASVALNDDLVQLADFKKMEAVRARVDQVVANEATADALKPWYNQFCKRPCFHDDYLAAFNRPGVHLVDTGGRGVEKITPAGAVVDGREYPLDCLIFATGFEVGTSFARRAGYQIRGVGGRTLEEKWAGGGRTLHGMTVNGFPNCFIFSQIQSGFTPNYPHALAEQAGHAAHIIAAANARGSTRVEPSARAEQGWTEEILAAVLDRRKFLEDCTPGYYNGEGQLSPVAASFSSYGKGSDAFFRLIAAWRDADDLAGLDLR